MRKRLPKYSSENKTKTQTMDIRELLRENIRTLAPYSTARDEYQGELGIYLDANENPYDNNYNRYPDPHQKNLKRRLAEIKGVPVEKIFIGNGSDEPIDLVFRLFCEPRRHNAVSIAPTYGMYVFSSKLSSEKTSLSGMAGLDFSRLRDARISSRSFSRRASAR